jgi:hypothetical protein
MWPEMSEYTYKYPAPGFRYPGGAQASLFSSQDRQTVDRHFDWMLDYGIDGVFVQRFVVGVASHPTNVLSHARSAANRTGRTFAITYDMSGQPTNTLYSQLTNDWRWLVDNLHITQDPRYLHHNGKPVLMIWGFFANRFSTNLAHQIIDFKAIPEAERFAGFLSISEGISGLVAKRDLEFSHDFTPTPPSTLSSGVAAVPQSHRNPGKYACSGRARLRKLPLAVP